MVVKVSVLCRELIGYTDDEIMRMGPPPIGFVGVYHHRRQTWLRRRQCSCGCLIMTAAALAMAAFRRGALNSNSHVHAVRHTDRPWRVSQQCAQLARAKHGRRAAGVFPASCYMQMSLTGSKEWLEILGSRAVRFRQPQRDRHHQKHMQPFPLLYRWHLTTQDRLFGHLRRLWEDDRPRIMVDLGCHAGHGSSWNLSDALLWLRYFNHTGGSVLAVDVFDDFVQDVQRRFDAVWPYSTLTGVRKQALTLALASDDANGEPMDLTGVASGHVSACAADWIAGFETSHGFPDHLCRITRVEKLHIAPGMTLSQRPPAAVAAASGSFAQQVLSMGATTGQAQQPTRALPRYLVRRERVDALWERRLGSRRIDFLKIDVDTSWLNLGLTGLFERRGFTIMVIEMDDSWGGVHPTWFVSQADQLIWFAALHGYSTFLKVPCVASPSAVYPNGMEPREAAWYFPLANASTLQPDAAPSPGADGDDEQVGTEAAAKGHRPIRFLPNRYYAGTAAYARIQDLMIVDAAQPAFIARLIALGRRDCAGNASTSRGDAPT